MSSTLFENNTLQGQVQISGKWEVAGMRNQTLFGGEWQDGSFRALFWDRLGPAHECVFPIPGSGVEAFLNPNLLIDPAAYVANRDFDRPAGFDYRDASFRAFHLSNLASFWQDRLKVFGGLRHDEQDQDVLNRSGELAERSPTVSKTVPQLGVIYSSVESVNVLQVYRSRLDEWMRETRDPLLVGFVSAPPGAIRVLHAAVQLKNIIRAIPVVVVHEIGIFSARPDLAVGRSVDDVTASGDAQERLVIVKGHRADTAHRPCSTAREVHVRADIGTVEINNCEGIRNEHRAAQ